jgi:hypothetical protein
MDAKISFTDVIQLRHQFQETEQRDQYNNYQHKATQKADADVAVKNFHWMKSNESRPKEKALISHQSGGTNR